MSALVMTSISCLLIYISILPSVVVVVAAVVVVVVVVVVKLIFYTILYANYALNF